MFTRKGWRKFWQVLGVQVLISIAAYCCLRWGENDVAGYAAPAARAYFIFGIFAALYSGYKSSRAEREGRDLK